MLKILIRQAHRNDLDEIKSLFSETIRNTCQEDYNDQQIKAWTSSSGEEGKWENLLLEEFFLVAESNHKIVGFGSLRNGHYFNLLYVYKPFQRQGIASLIYENLKEKANNLGNHKLTSDVSITAKPFFEAKGFEVFKKNYKEIRGVKIINYSMST